MQVLLKAVEKVGIIEQNASLPGLAIVKSAVFDAVHSNEYFYL
jgi:hypothetical protein